MIIRDVIKGVLLRDEFMPDMPLMHIDPDHWLLDGKSQNRVMDISHIFSLFTTFRDGYCIAPRKYILYAEEHYPLLYSLHVRPYDNRHRLLPMAGGFLTHAAHDVAFSLRSPSLSVVSLD